jgi:hypothetical protein
MEAGTLENDLHEVRLGMNVSAFQINLYGHLGSDLDVRAQSAELSQATLHCIEWWLDGQNHAMRVWLDDAEVTEFATSDWVAQDSQNGNTNPQSDWSPSYEAIRFGWELSGQTIYYDDIAIHTERIGCLPE